MSGKTAQIKITLIKSPISQKPSIRKTVAALGLKRLQASQVKEAKPEILGMVRTVAHLVRVEEVHS